MCLEGLQELAKQGLRDPKQIGDLDFCENCILGKAHMLRFTTAVHRTKGTLDYIHSDLWGSRKVPFSLSKAQYFIT